jgi:uncharacterized membrane protein YdjX (TVP38/TMEM64 family)
MGISRRALKWLAVAVGAVCLALVVWAVWDHRAVVMGWIERARPFPFFSALAVLPLIGLPVTPLFVLAGASFGVKIGIAGSLAAIGANLIVCYFIGRRMRAPLESLFRRFDFRLPNIAESHTSPTRFALGVKLAPGVPTFVKNYALGLIGIPFRIYFGISMLITGVYAILLVVLGESLLEHRFDRRLWIALAVVAVGLVVVWRLRARRRSG